LIVDLGVRKGEQPPWIVPDGLWERIEPLLPVIERRHRHAGRKRIDDRKVLCGILFVLYTAITCWRRLRDWHEAGVWDKLHEMLLAELQAADQLDWSKAVVDGSHTRALKGGPKPVRARSTAPNRAPNTTSSVMGTGSPSPSR
jgi:transposase